ncbi:hypothetical protein ABZ797_36075 [Streptomyces antimycoticus]|uniref:hypothetical protein n=1 Tax=Streptomyces antimycoticus TaxID=68175 RepID=UPI0033D8606F
MLVISVILTIAGAILSVSGIYWGAAGTVRRYATLKEELQQLDAIARDPVMPEDEKNSRRHAVLAPSGDWGMVEYFNEHSQLNALTLVIEGLKWPAVLTVLGVVAGAGGSLTSLWL